MSSIKLSEEVTIKDDKLIENSNASLDEIISNIISYFTDKKSALINDVESGNIPFSSLETEISYYIDANDIFLKGATKQQLYNEVYNYLYKYYIIQKYLDEDSITDIKVSSDSNIWTKRIINNQAIRVLEKDTKFQTKDTFKNFCKYVARRNGTELNDKNSIRIITDKTRCQDYRLRIDITSERINCNDLPCITIRKLPKKKKMPKDLIAAGMINEEIDLYLQEIIPAGAQIIICGEGGSGKSTFLDAYIECIDDNTHALVLQESEEIFSDKPNIFCQRTKEKSAETDTETSLRDLTKNAMRMDVNMIVISEILGGEVFYLFDAGYSGHIAWCTMHGPSSYEAIRKLMQYLQYSDVSLRYEDAMEMFSRQDLVVFLKDFKCLEITEIAGYDVENNKVIYNPVFEFDLNTETFKRLNPTCERLQKKIDYYKYKKRRREECLNIV